MDSHDDGLIKPRVGFVVPVYNEARRLSAIPWNEFFSRDETVWLFVDDGSTDSSWLALEKLSENHSNVSCLRQAQNQGKAEAVRIGMQTLLDDPRNDVVGFLDADGAFDVLDLDLVIREGRAAAMQNDFDAIWTSRVALAGREIERTRSRHYLGRGVSTLLGMRMKRIPYDTQSGLKVFVASTRLRQCLIDPFKTRWLFDVELMIRWKLTWSREMRILEVPVHSWRDVRGSRIRGRELARVATEFAVVLRMAGQYGD